MNKSFLKIINKKLAYINYFLYLCIEFINNINYKRKIMEEEKITYIPEMEVANNARMDKLDFSCLFTMYDMGFKERKSNLFNSPEISKSKPHWFKYQTKITLEAIDHLDPYQLGMLIKQSKATLDNYINNQMGN